jgi:hypothetical protein
VQITFPWPNDKINLFPGGGAGERNTSLEHEETKTTLHEYDTYLLPGVLFSELAIYAFPPQKLRIRQTEEEEKEAKEAPRGRRAQHCRCFVSTLLPFVVVHSSSSA